jgi:hypothetical protein
MAGLIVLPYSPSRESYRQLKKMSADRLELPRTWNGHLLALHGAALRFQSEGYRACLVAVDPIGLHAWCARFRRHCDAAARLEYAREQLAKPVLLQKDDPRDA